MEPMTKSRPTSIPNRRKTVRRDEDNWRLRHIEASDALLPEVIYDAKTILMSVHWLTDGLREEIAKLEEASVPEPKAFRERWSHVLDCLGDGARGFIERMKEIRLQIQPSHCSVEKVVVGVLKHWSKIAQKEGISIRCENLENCPPVLAYEWRLRSVFSSVIGRAVQVTQPGGSITVSGRVDQGQSIGIIEVLDAGPHLAPQFCDAFNSGEELNVTEKPTGLSAWHVFDLQQARKIAETHGSRIFIQSSEEHGTKCSIRFPIT